MKNSSFKKFRIEKCSGLKNRFKKCSEHENI
jgi:hypothetical protein